ncbi:MAG: hypothetical protein ABL949_08025 [Fimbriimonadaceae bacterium]
MRVAIALLFAVGQVPKFEFDYRRDALETATDAYLLGPDIFVASANVKRVTWSSDGQYLAIQQEHEDTKTLHVWSRKTKQLAKVAELQGTLRPVFQLKAHTLWVVGVTEKSTLFRFNLSTMKGTILDIGGAEFCDVAPDPKSDAAVLALGNGEGDDSKTWLVLWQPGNSRLVQLSGVRNPQEVIWDKKGPFLTQGYYGPGTVASSDEVRKNLSTAINFSTGELSPSTYMPTDWEQPTLYSKATTGKIGKNSIRGHWLFGVEPGQNADHSPKLTSASLQALIAADTKGATVSSDGSAVAYWDRTNLFVREIEKIDIEKYEKDYEEWERKRLAENAKQVGMAMAIYASDADDLLPINDGQFDRLFPYAEDPSVFDGFSYELGAKELSGYPDKDKTILGTVQGRFGRIVLYLDTHVVWEPRKKP